MRDCYAKLEVSVFLHAHLFCFCLYPKWKDRMAWFGRPDNHSKKNVWPSYFISIFFSAASFDGFNLVKLRRDWCLPLLKHLVCWYNTQKASNYHFKIKCFSSRRETSMANSLLFFPLNIEISVYTMRATQMAQTSIINT